VDIKQERELLPEKLRYFWTWVMSDNIAEELDEDELNEIGAKVYRGYQLDIQSREDWDKNMGEAMKIAKQVKEIKNFPWPNAANVKYPLITTACIQFAARAYPELIQGHETVRCMVVGEDHDGSKMEKAIRVSKHMSWQLVDEMEEWEDDSDRLLHVLPVMGLCYKKTYWSPIKGRNVSEFLLPDDVIVHYRAKTLETVRRITQRYEWYNNDIHERIEQGLWLDIREFLTPTPQTEGYDFDEEAPHRFLEQHRWLDLDDDGYEEPYIVTIHEESMRVVRIVARYELDGIRVKGNKIIRIVPTHYFTKFSFIPNPDGSFYDLGFGLLLNPLNEAVNTTINQLLDAGTLANLGGGFLARGVRMKGGPITHVPGQWTPIDTPAMDLKQGIVPLPYKEPSRVLFELLGLLINASRDISSVKDVLTGEQPGQNVPATTVLALIEQGLKVFSAIYKRIFRAFAKELKKIFQLNSLYLDENVYFQVLDTPMAVAKEDYDVHSLDVRPLADPSISSDAQRLSKAQALMALKGDKGINQDEINYRYLEAIRVPNIEALLIPPEQQTPDVDPRVKAAEINAEIDMQKLELEKKRIELEEMKLQIDMAKAQGEIARWEAQAFELTRRAESHGERNEVAAFKAQIEQLKTELQHQVEMLKAQIELAKAKIKAMSDTEKAQATLEASRRKESAEG
jgi:chaperonin GroES